MSRCAKSCRKLHSERWGKYESLEVGMTWCLGGWGTVNGPGNKMSEVRGVGMGQGLQTSHPVGLRALSVGERFFARELCSDVISEG